ncbi:MAG: hypothetical protein WCF16_11515 [Alphaproteobacteria bacterium]
MTTIIIHGTLAKGSSWYWNSWGARGFCHALGEAMQAVTGGHDIWRVKGKPVGAIPELNPSRTWDPLWGAGPYLQTVDGRYEWTGTPEGLARGAAAVGLARYLSALRQATDEPIRIIAHSHGCNVVKLASSLPELAPDVRIDRAVFLACPHFWEPDYVFEQPKTLADRFDLRKQMRPKRVGRKFRYQASPGRFGRILNLYSRRDAVQITLAKTLSGAYAPQTGGFFENLAKMLRTGDVYEMPQATRTDSDPDAAALYENLEMPVAKDCSDIGAHSVMHGAAVAKLAGVWIESRTDLAAVVARAGGLPEVAPDDTGE